MMSRGKTVGGKTVGGKTTGGAEAVVTELACVDSAVGTVLGVETVPTEGAAA